MHAAGLSESSGQTRPEGPSVPPKKQSLRPDECPVNGDVIKSKKSGKCRFAIVLIQRDLSPA